MEKTKKGEIILYQPEGGEFHIDVRLEDDTVWLTQAQMAELFDSSRTNILEHIQNIYNEQELQENSTCRKFRQVRVEGSRKVAREIPFYNLDMIVALGYRVKSIVATRFRQWANQVLKEHLLYGCSLNHRFLLEEERIDQQLVGHEKCLQKHENHFNALDIRIDSLEKQVEFFVKANLPPSEGVLEPNTLWSGYEFACQLVRSAKSEILIVDPFGDDVALNLLSKKAKEVSAALYTSRITRTLKDEAARLNRQNPKVELCNMHDVHDRFIIVDEIIYHIGASIKDLGNKLAAFSVLHFVTKEQLLGMIK